MTEADSSLVLGILGEIRAEVRDIRALRLANTEAIRRLDRRFDSVDRRFNEAEQRFKDLRDDLELMLKMETIGRAAHFETVYEERLRKLRDRIEEIGGAAQPPPNR